jgi:DNA-binding FadR family transcriptional regulator
MSDICTDLAGRTMDQRSYTNKGRHADILHELGRAIVGDVYREGAPLPRETELQEKFGASRQTVREAIKVLAAKGMVYARKRAGTFVTPRAGWNFLDPDILAWHAKGSLPSGILRDLVEIRRLIEPTAAEFAAERSGDEGIARIGRALDEMHIAVRDPAHFYEADIQFHLAIFAASGNTLIDRMSTILRPLLEASFRIQSEANTDRGLDDGYGVHMAVFEAIEKRDGPRAKTAMQALLDRATTEVYAKTPR